VQRRERGELAGKKGKKRRRKTYKAASKNTLEVPSSVTKDDEGHTTLLPQPVNPSKHPNPLPPLLNRLLNLDLTRVLLRLLKNNRLSLLEFLLFRSALCLSLSGFTNPQFLLLDQLLLVSSEELGGLLLSRGGHGNPRGGSVVLCLLADLDGGEFGELGDEGA
jgi:hypothetical protein